jgi:hypothetical protein
MEIEEVVKLDKYIKKHKYPSYTEMTKRFPNNFNHFDCEKIYNNILNATVVQRIGAHLHTDGGVELMRMNFYIISSVFKDRKTERIFNNLLCKIWLGIGNWGIW